MQSISNMDCMLSKIGEIPMTDSNENAMKEAMSEAYWQMWNDDVQTRIDRDIEANRKADASFEIPGIPAGTEVKVEQLSHDFIFGAHIFNFDQLGTDERNERYKELYGTLFNSATIAFYWKKFELEEGKPRFKGEYRDTAEYWNSVTDPKNEPHWRRPATDPVVEFCESKGIRLHGHTLTWGNRKWQVPDWLVDKMPAPFREKYIQEGECHSCFYDAFEDFTPEQVEALLPEYTRELNYQMVNRIIDIALYYKDRLQSWDIVNESAIDFGNEAMVQGSGISKTRYGLMPGDHTYRSFKVAEGVFPENVKLNINDFYLTQAYTDQVNDLIKRNCKIDIMGAQMHLFDPQICLDIADGKSDMQSPESVWETMDMLAQADRPIHLSEITITAPNNDERGQNIQAVIARNLYRLWFSVKPMMGITWWNVVDDCGAPGEPSVSGLFTRDMEPKSAYFELNKLINEEWKTSTVVHAESDGTVNFRGFRGNYKLTWQDVDGNEQSSEFYLK